MSVRGYRVIIKKTAKAHTFSFWHNPYVSDWICNDYRGENGGDIEFNKTQLKELLEDYRMRIGSGEKTEIVRGTECSLIEIVFILEKIIKEFKRGEEYIQYECY